MTIDEYVRKKAPVACDGILLCIGMCGAVIFGVAIDAPALSPMAAFGAMIAMQITPRHGVRAKIIGALAGCLFMLLAASLSLAISGVPPLALALLFLLSWLASLPKKDLAYLGFVTKCATVAFLLGYFDFRPSLPMAVYFCSGILLGLFLSLTAMAFEDQNEQRPIDQLRELLHGDINSLGFSLITPFIVVASSLLAQIFSYSNPAWVGLTVIFVSSSDHSLELRRVLDRVVGTILGTLASYFILSNIFLPLRLALIVGACAFFMPFSIKRYSVFSFLITCVVLILINITMMDRGGDMGLLLWRCIDTAFGCACVLIANLILRYLGWRIETHGAASSKSHPASQEKIQASKERQN